MRILWTLLKVAVGLAIAIPLGLVALGLAFGIVGTVVGLVFMLVRFAVVGLLVYGAFRLAKTMFGWGSSKPKSQPLIRELPARDPYCDAAMRELDAEMGHNR